MSEQETINKGMKLLFNHINTNKIVAGIIACVAVYALVKVVPQITSIYQGWSNYFEGSSNIYPLLITAITALVPLSIFGISYLVFRNKRSLIILALSIHSVLIFSSYAVYGVLTLVLYWWLMNLKNTKPNSKLS